MEIHAVNIIYDICIMSALMLIAKIIRTKIKIIQKLYIPSALVAGFLGLLLGKQFLNVIPFNFFNTCNLFCYFYSHLKYLLPLYSFF